MLGLRIRKRCLKPRLRLAQGGQTRGNARQLALRTCMALARRIRRLLQLAPAVPALGLGLGGRRDLGFGRAYRCAARLRLGACALKLALDIGQTITFREPARRAGWRVGGDPEAIPAPEITFR